MKNPRIPRVSRRYPQDVSNFYLGKRPGYPRIRSRNIVQECELGSRSAFRSKMCILPPFHLAANTPVDIRKRIMLLYEQNMERGEARTPFRCHWIPKASDEINLGFRWNSLKSASLQHWKCIDWLGFPVVRCRGLWKRHWSRQPLKQHQCRLRGPWCFFRIHQWHWELYANCMASSCHEFLACFHGLHLRPFWTRGERSWCVQGNQGSSEPVRIVR